MADSSWSSSSSGQFRLIDLKLPPLNDQNMNTQVQKTHTKHQTRLLRQPLLVSVCHILKPATSFIDSILLGNKVPECENDKETSNLSEFNSALSELNEFIDGRYLNTSAPLERVLADIGGPPGWYVREDFSAISDLKTLAGHYYLMIPTLMMEEIANNAMKKIDEINVCQASIDLLQFLTNLSWDAKAVNTISCFVFKFLEFFGFLLHGPNQPLTKIESSMAELKGNHVSIMGLPVENFHLPLNQLNNLIKLALATIEYASDLTLLSDTEDDQEDLLSTSMHWAILSVVVCYLQITLLIDNWEVALELSLLISNLNQILSDLKHHCTICKPQIEDMNAYMQQIAFIKDAFENIEEPLSDIGKLELMKSFMYSKDDFYSLIDGSTMSKVDIEDLKEKCVILFISELNVKPWLMNNLIKVYMETKEEDYYKIVWVPFVLKWTEELRQKFDNLKSKMPWYVVCNESPIAALWYVKGQWHFRRAFLWIDAYGCWNQVPFAHLIYLARDNSFPFKRLYPRSIFTGGGDRPTLKSLYDYEPHNEDANQNKPSSGFQGFVAMRKGLHSEAGKSYNLELHSEELSEPYKEDVKENIQKKIESRKKIFSLAHRKL